MYTWDENHNIWVVSWDISEIQIIDDKICPKKIQVQGLTTNNLRAQEIMKHDEWMANGHIQGYTIKTEKMGAFAGENSEKDQKWDGDTSQNCMSELFAFHGF